AKTDRSGRDGLADAVLAPVCGRLLGPSPSGPHRARPPHGRASPRRLQASRGRAALSADGTAGPRGRAVLRRTRQEGVRNASPTVADTFPGRAVQPGGQENQPSFRPWQSHGPLKRSSKRVVALLPFTVLARRVRTLWEL